jgi:hypothetical protein
VPIFEGIEAAWLESGWLPRKVDLAFSACCEVRHYNNGEIHRDSSYAEKLPTSERTVIELRGELEGVEEGTLVAFIRFASHTLPDFWAEGFRPIVTTCIASATPRTSMEVLETLRLW